MWKCDEFYIPSVIISHTHCSVTWWWIFIMKWQANTERLTEMKGYVVTLYQILIDFAKLHSVGETKFNREKSPCLISHRIPKKHIFRVKIFNKWNENKHVRKTACNPLQFAWIVCLWQTAMAMWFIHVHAKESVHINKIFRKERVS